MALWLSGIGVSRGIGIGRVQRLYGGDLEIPEYTLPDDQVEAEVQRFDRARARAREQLEAVRKGIPARAASEIAAFIDTHLLMLEDRTLTLAVPAQIRDTRCNAEAALKRQRDTLVAVFEQMDDPYLRARKDDVTQVASRVLRILLKQDKPLPTSTEASAGSGPLIIVAEDVTAADLILLSQQGAAGFITEYGGPLSHSAILARSLSIPAIVGAHGVRRLLHEGETVIVDGDKGHAIADPDQKALIHYRTRQEEQAADRAALASLRNTPAVSRDGVKIHLLANIEQPEDAADAAQLGAEGVGLYRTEFLFMNRRDSPDEDEQYEAYAKVVSSVQGPITIRTLDLGADKQIQSGRASTVSNPALGLRSIRLCLKNQTLFRTQVRALLRASVHGDLRIMLPMISNVGEFRQAQAIIRYARAQLHHAGVQVSEKIPIGAMIEVPAAALAAPWLARHAAFFSIGTNDLIQYTLAIDRVDDEVNYLYDPLHPAVLSLIRMTIDAGHKAGIPVAMCGEMAGDPRYTRLLLGLGLTEFSMHPANVLEVKRNVLGADISALHTQAAAVFEAPDMNELRERLRQIA
ncbi:MAG: phosphoenolpyruvate--protein phosphotransferase [Nevskiaceae bacterium]|nr:MAG: phosphoenolpyruvate--protein phosphotransferase [Nevskiaceae bacterium]TBR73335.1 MAG: phosphoenolpyruvate--protein phosphotransferase [Nevskiaceae bacterium]